MKPHVKKWQKSSVVFREASHGDSMVGFYGGFSVKPGRGSRGLSRKWQNRGVVGA